MMKQLIQLFMICLLITPTVYSEDNTKKFINQNGVVTNTVTKDVPANETMEDNWWEELPDYKSESVVEKIINFVTHIGYRIWPSKPWGGWVIFFVAAYIILRIFNFTSDYIDELLWNWFKYRR